MFLSARTIVQYISIGSVYYVSSKKGGGERKAKFFLHCEIFNRRSVIIGGIRFLRVYLYIIIYRFVIDLLYWDILQYN